jgi:hypothetical protein
MFAENIVPVFIGLYPSDRPSTPRQLTSNHGLIPLLTTWMTPSLFLFGDTAAP